MFDDEKPLEKLLQSRFAALGDLSAMRLYEWFGQHEECSRHDARVHATGQINLWQRAIEIRIGPFMTGTTIEFTRDQNTLDDWQKFYSSKHRMYQLATAIGTSKVALDACLDGYYTQSLALIRTMFEAWKRAA